MANGQREFITVVTGLPRTGTSMMMRMVEAGGIPVMIDGVREADDDNPRGYYEFEAVKKTKQDASWVNSANGKAVKLVYRLLYDLPAGQSFRLLFMRRKLSEVLASQDAMLERLNHDQAGKMNQAQFEQLFGQELNKVESWLRDQSHMSTLDVDYNQMIENPQPQVEAINEFLGGDLDVEAMRQVVEPSLHRQRR